MISIILPAYNEAGRLPACLERLAAWTAGQPDQRFEIIVIPNGCSDNTLTVGVNSALVFADNTTVYIRPMKQKSKAAAVRKGMLSAYGQYRIMADVDLATPPEEWGKLLEPLRLGRAAIAIGSRYMPGADCRMSLGRRVSGAVFHALARPLIGGIHDSQCGFKAFTATAASLFLDMRTTSGAFDVELLWLAHQSGYRVVEVPVQWIADGESRFPVLRNFVSMAGELYKIRGLHQQAQPR